ncbi:hypothetical protein AX774_g270 [Zancudomyces culisetae]|uniref:Uncharacterized protein n=1 Tax=Zancudomyces culisetae TaxID=1213189 RepID=A0A1R1PYW3_ZANCU|nr:hypothetical protein AX774_g270 [Zancudomyces culisetae]|eukprot:OMH86156.1 hypothetical protein AX774_g270 [Zancudomyces culisetae]
MIDSNDAEYYDFVEKISRIDLNNASFEEIWESLDEPSKLEFQQLFGSSYSNTQEGKDIIEQAIQQHLPWWENPQKPSVVLTEDRENDTTTLDKQVDLLETYQNKKEYLQSPAAYRDVKLLSQISNKKAHPSVFNQLMGVM